MCNIQGCKKIWYSESNNWEFIKPSQCKKIGHAKVKQLLVQAKDEELQGRLDRLRKIIDKIYDVDNNNNNNNDDNNNNNINFYDRNDNDSNVGGEELSSRYRTSRHRLTMLNNYFVDIMISEHLCFETYRPGHQKGQM